MLDPKKERGPLDEPHMPEWLDTDALNVGSATDYTGLIPAAPVSEEALEAYEDLEFK